METVMSYQKNTFWKELKISMGAEEWVGVVILLFVVIGYFRLVAGSVHGFL